VIDLKNQLKRTWKSQTIFSKEDES